MGKKLSICIVGGGTAGWLTALYVNKLLPNAEIKVVESSEIGIIGAGEGSTISLITFLQDLDISLADIIKYTDATIKLGIKFANWNGDSSYYYHPFGPYLGKHSFNLSNFNIELERTKSTTTNDDSRLYLGLASVSNEDLTNKILNNILSEKNKVNILDTNSVTSLHALHFDSFKLGAYLKQVGLKRGILLIEDEVIDVKADTFGNITTLLTTTKELSGDFFFDCSGFTRLIIGKKYNIPWIDYSKHLLVDTAIPFHQPVKTEIEPYTTATAMNAGWLWEIPLQSRIGSGYIYSSKHTTDEDALTELSNYLGYTPDIIKKIKFKPGRFENVWVNNCISIGLSSGFTEPIEATSIMMTTVQLSLLNSHIAGITFNSKKVVEQYNKIIGDISDHVMEFLSFHYITERQDTLFWKELKTREFLPSSIKSYLELWKDQMPTSLDNHSYWDQFTADNYLMVGEGLKVFDKFKSNWISNLKHTGAVNNKQYWNKVEELLNSIVDKCPTHKSFINKICYD